MEFLDLVKQGKHTAIMSFVTSCKCLGSIEEIALINRGNHAEIMSYIATHFLEPDSFEVFLKRGVLNEVRLYIARHGWYEGTEKQILDLGKGVHDEFVGYLIRQKNIEKNSSGIDWSHRKAWWFDVEKLLIECGNHCAIRRYISQVQLEKPSLLQLRRMGNSEDILIHDLLWGK